MHRGLNTKYLKSHQLYKNGNTIFSIYKKEKKKRKKSNTINCEKVGGVSPSDFGGA